MMDSQMPGPRQPMDIVFKYVGSAVGLVFAGIGMTMLVFLWGSPFGDFPTPPLFFRVFASFIALVFVIIGGGVFFGNTIGPKLSRGIPPSMGEEGEKKVASAEEAGLNATVSYTCKHCGAPLGKGVDVSPHGDVKCNYCNAWFNIHGE